MKLDKNEAYSLIQRLLEKHYEETENTIRKFKWLVELPQHGEEYTKNLNVFELQEKAIKKLYQEKEDINILIRKLLK